MDNGLDDLLVQLCIPWACQCLGPTPTTLLGGGAEVVGSCNAHTMTHLHLERIHKDSGEMLYFLEDSFHGTPSATA